MRRAQWAPMGTCSNTDWKDEEDREQVFFPGRGRPLANPPYRQHCDPCPVKQECLKYAAVHKIQDGVWGGLRPNERAALPADLVKIWEKTARERGEYEGSFADYLDVDDTPKVNPEESLVEIHAFAL